MESLRYANKKKISFYSGLAFLLGLSLNDNIFAVFSYGSTYFYFGQLLSIFIFLILFIQKGCSIRTSIKAIPRVFLLLFALISTSIIIGAPFSASFDLYVYRAFASFILLIVNIITLIDVIALEKNHRYIILGMIIGLLLNLSFSSIAYFTFSSGNMFSLKSFSIRKYDFIDFYYIFRTQGMFLEPSHFARYIILISFVLVGYRLQYNNKINFIDLVISALTLFIFFLTRSGSIAIFAAGLFFFLVLLFLSGGVTKRIKKTMGMALVLFAFAIGLFLAVSKFDFFGSLSSIVSGANIASEENAERFNSIKYGLSLIADYPFGAGWGLSGTLYEGSSFVAPFSFLLGLTLEIGVFGVFVYLVSIIGIMVRLIKQKNIYSIALCTSLLCLLMLQLGTDFAFDSLTMAVIGFSVCISKKNKYCKIEKRKRMQNEIFLSKNEAYSL